MYAAQILNMSTKRFIIHFTPSMNPFTALHCSNVSAQAAVLQSAVLLRLSDLLILVWSRARLMAPAQV
jgi:hypothetical protein